MKIRVQKSPKAWCTEGDAPLTVVLHCHSPASTATAAAAATERPLTGALLLYSAHRGAPKPCETNKYRKGEGSAGPPTDRGRLALVASCWPAGTKWQTAPAGSPQGLGGPCLAQKPGLLLEGLPSAPRQLTVTGQSNPGPRSGGRHSWSPAPDD